MGKYIKNALTFTLILGVIFLAQWLYPLSAAQTWLIANAGGNWAWPLSLLFGTLLGVRFLDSDFQVKQLKISNATVILFVTALYFLKTNFTHLNFSHLTVRIVLYQLIVSLSEEIYFRGLGLRGLSRIEGKFYGEARTKELAPLSLLLSCAVYGAMHGVTPVLNGSGAFSWSWYSSAFQASLIYSFIYVITGSVLASGWAHFLSNVIR